MSSPSSRYSAEQVSPPQIIVSFSQSWRRVIKPIVPQRGQDITAMYGILRMTELGLVFENENRSGVHFFGDPLFEKLQVGRHPALRESDVTER